MLLHGLLQYAQKSVHDFHNLGRWASWTLALNPLHRTQIVVAYCPGRTKKSGLKTVYQQHLRYIKQHSLRCTPYKLFLEDLCAQLCSWQSDGDQIVLFLDANKHITHGCLGKALAECGADLSKISHTFWPPGRSPHTYIAGTLPIDGIYVSTDIDCTDLLSLSFKESVGDHRTMILEVSTLSALGQLQGNVVRPTSR